MSFRQSVERVARIAPSAYKTGLWSEAMKMKRGMVFIYAMWSGTSVLSWQVLTEILSKLPELPMILVVDIDAIPLDDVEKFLDQFSYGNGEVIWIKEGQKIAMLPWCTARDENAVITHTTDLMSC